MLHVSDDLSKVDDKSYQVLELGWKERMKEERRRKIEEMVHGEVIRAREHRRRVNNKSDLAGPVLRPIHSRGGKSAYSNHDERPMTVNSWIHKVVLPCRGVPYQVVLELAGDRIFIVASSRRRWKA